MGCQHTYGLTADYDPEEPLPVSRSVRKLRADTYRIDASGPQCFIDEHLEYYVSHWPDEPPQSPYVYRRTRDGRPIVDPDIIEGEVLCDDRTA